MRNRIIEIIHSVVPFHRRFKALEDMTAIRAQTWRSICDGRQRATEETIGALCEHWPRYAYWLGTGRTDERAGHTSPVLERVARDLEVIGRVAKRPEGSATGGETAQQIHGQRAVVAHDAAYSESSRGRR